MAQNLSDLTTLHVGGPAKRVVHVHTEEELITTVKQCDESNEPLLILGSGSNVLVGDLGFDGTVLIVETRGNSYEIDACSGGTLQVAAGENWDKFVEFTISKDLANLECLSGIPGTVGGAPIQNIGAYGHEVAEVIARIRTYDRKKKEIHTFMASDCDFSYRSSIFKKEPERYVILDVTFQLRRGETSLQMFEKLFLGCELKKECFTPTRIGAQDLSLLIRLFPQIARQNFLQMHRVGHSPMGL